MHLYLIGNPVFLECKKNSIQKHQFYKEINNTKMGSSGEEEIEVSIPSHHRLFFSVSPAIFVFVRIHF